MKYLTFFLPFRPVNGTALDCFALPWTIFWPHPRVAYSVLPLSYDWYISSAAHPSLQSSFLELSWSWFATTARWRILTSCAWRLGGNPLSKIKHSSPLLVIYVICLIQRYTLEYSAPFLHHPTYSSPTQLLLNLLLNSFCDLPLHFNL